MWYCKKFEHDYGHDTAFLANVNSLYAIARPSVACRLSVCLPVTLVRPIHAAKIFRNISTTLEIVPGEPLRRGS